MVVCKSCGLEHSPMIRCEVAKRMLGRAAELKKAGEVLGKKIEVEVAKKEAEGKAAAPVKAVDGKKVAWATREEYNAYMKEYMRVWRKKK